jgi:hypothetical protein
LPTRGQTILFVLIAVASFPGPATAQRNKVERTLVTTG